MVSLEIFRFMKKRDCINKGVDQLHLYLEADLRLLFSHSKNPVFSCHGSNVHHAPLEFFACFDAS